MANPDLLDAPTLPKADPSLEYTPRFGPAGPVTVRGIRLLVALTLVNTTLLGASVMGPQLFPFLRQSWQQWQARRVQERARQAALTLQQQCLDHLAPPGQVTYDEDPIEAAKRLNEAGGWKAAAASGLRNVPPGWTPPVKAPPPAYFPRYTDAVHGVRVSGVDEPLLFLGGRTTPGGARHVVTVQLVPRHDFTRSDDTGRGVKIMQTKGRTLFARAYPAGPDGPSAARGKHVGVEVDLVLQDSKPRPVAVVGGYLNAGQSQPVDYGDVLRFHAGQPDPADPSHFTIPYELDGRAGVIDGWLRDDGLQLRPREGQWTFTSDGQAWALPTGPAPRPSPPGTAPAAP